MNYPNGIPVLAGDVLVTFAPELTWKNWRKEFKFSLFKILLYRVQRHALPLSPREYWWATHTRTYLGDGMCSNVTTPEARIDQLDPDLFHAHCIAVRYANSSEWGSDDINAMLTLAEQMAGKKYDYTQLLEMGLNIVFDEQIKDGARVLHSKKENVVCSVGSHLLLLAACESAKRHNLVLPRPLGQYDPITGKGSAEATTPCHLLNHSLTMEIVYRN